VADALTVQVKGARELRRAFKGMKDELRDLSALHRAIAADVLASILGTVPRDSGDLAGSLTPKGTRTKAYVRSTLVYAPVIHYGWPRRGIAPNPYGDRGRAAARGSIERAYRDGIAKIVDKVQTP
jgi:hypothetical protein